MELRCCRGSSGAPASRCPAGPGRRGWRRARAPTAGGAADGPDRGPLLAAAALHGLGDAVLCGPAAASWLSGGRLPMPWPVPTASPPGRSRRVEGARQLALDADEVVEVGGLRCSSPARTAADLLRLQPRTTALVAVDTLTHWVLTAPEEIGLALQRRARQRGAVRA